MMTEATILRFWIEIFLLIFLVDSRKSHHHRSRFYRANLKLNNFQCFKSNINNGTQKLFCDRHQHKINVWQCRWRFVAITTRFLPRFHSPQCRWGLQISSKNFPWIKWDCVEFMSCLKLRRLWCQFRILAHRLSFFPHQFSSRTLSYILNTEHWHSRHPFSLISTEFPLKCAHVRDENRQI